MDEKKHENRVLLRGIPLEQPEFSHESHGRRFQRLTLSVERLSGTYDHIHVLAESGLVEALEPAQGPMLEVEGQIRSYHYHTPQGRHLIISVYAERMEYRDGEPENRVSLLGTICREPVYRFTPLGREICDVMLYTERRYHRRDYVPCILWGSVARMGAMCPVGSMLELRGRLQSRRYIKRTPEGEEERTAFEVSAVTARNLALPLGEDFR